MNDGRVREVKLPPQIREFLQALDQSMFPGLRAIHQGHLHVQEDEINWTFAQELHGLFAAGRQANRESELAQGLLEHRAYGFVVLDDENRGLR